LAELIEPLTAAVGELPHFRVDFSGAGLGIWLGRVGRSIAVLPLSDGLPARRFPMVNVSLIVLNFAVWLFYELPNLNSAGSGRVVPQTQ
jgi:hypothetical protein